MPVSMFTRKTESSNCCARRATSAERDDDRDDRHQQRHEPGDDRAEDEEEDDQRGWQAELQLAVLQVLCESTLKSWSSVSCR